MLEKNKGTQCRSGRDTSWLMGFSQAKTFDPKGQVETP
jgi:hypothetical protein